MARLHDGAFYASEPFDVYRRLRNEAPVWWYGQGPFWALTKWEDIRFVSSHPVEFSSASGNKIDEKRNPGRITKRLNDGAPENIIGSDPPRHNQLRRLVSKAFTPRMVKSLEPKIRTLTGEILDTISPNEVVDFSALISSIPTYVISDLLGCDREFAPLFKRWAENAVKSVDIDTESIEWQEVERLNAELWQFMAGEIGKRRANPGDDLVSALMDSEIEGEQLSQPNLVMMLCTLLVAGSDTTKSLMAGGALEFARHPDQLDLLVADPGLASNAVEELLRWVSPLHTFCRTATVDTQIGGQEIAAGDYIAMVYPAANRDEDIWERAEELDITRSVDPMHLAFGWGEHACLGSHLARLETRVLFEELAARYPRWELAGPYRKWPSTIINIIDELPIRLGA